MDCSLLRPEGLTTLMGTSIVIVLALEPNGLVAALHRVASCKGTGPGHVGILAGTLFPTRSSMVHRAFPVGSLHRHWDDFRVGSSFADNRSL